MTDNLRTRYGEAPPVSGRATVTQLDTRRQANDVLSSITFVFGGVHYGTVPVNTPYTRGQPIVLYIVPQTDRGDDTWTGPLDCLVTDNSALAEHLGVAR
jgi:hypothetical protein